MAPRGSARQAETRARVANEAARVMAELGITDYHLARRKAAERLRVRDPRSLPANDEIETALAAYQRLFRADSQPAALRARRELAVEAMSFLHAFEPRLVGAVLTGTADATSPVVLHLFADAPEEITLFLLDQGIDCEQGERRIRTSPTTTVELPTHRFLADEVPVELVVFHGRFRRQPALGPVDGRPMKRAGIDEVRALLATGALA